ncbi:E3 ubiquitin-protein ligase SINA-like 7 isoform X4 [Arabidopsis lyrata subsp. lyrata]|uniref:E3 ubiquitin-protein ligase SINA-like 7 isoform X4 n=1 Tax=Arabidopsis lyrata subsp. lyrata TaxID=81972 RepID=UPI000A29DFE5|nr:E3 ubiquitin-protein ligase SINA-like 7 isoform X4 [Arabidopsis lyrata subsp. lyrata]|eukprot:XP_020872352.1 E3 ubiquitin-protein ligase SINA-like 7 isoform X4 [Arabidopsis lyrata subsp. lyrata]
MVGAAISESSGEGIGSNSILSQKRQLSSSDGAKRDAKKRSIMLMELEILDCPICYEAFTIPIFQCDNGHLACSSCCPKLNNKCPACASPVGHNRCRAMESVLESILVPCPNAKLGCTKKFSYGKESTHEKECIFSQCSCPALDCNYTCSYKDLYRHYHTTHLECFQEPYGVYVTVSCIAPSAPEVGNFSYDLSYTVDGQTMTYKSPKMKMILEVSFQTPQENFMLIPNNLLRGDMLDMKLLIKELKQE